MLGEVTPYGVQTSIENFETLGEGAELCRRHGLRSAIEVSSVTVGMREASILCAIRGGADSISAAAMAARTSILAARLSAERLSGAGLIDLGPEGGRVGARSVRLTGGGMDVADRLLGGGFQNAA
ncbi:hypothetical protein [Falsiroseomonas sp. CW058]|uniref:hypothetical protein n=1 Tax=Falsiroseomonas sp. CW058 TaxID=3388664 RepID=UPI003D31FAF9